MVSMLDTETLLCYSTPLLMFGEVSSDLIEALLKFGEVSLYDLGLLSRFAELLFCSVEVSLQATAVSSQTVEVSPKAWEKVLELGEMSLSYSERLF